MLHAVAAVVIIFKMMVGDREHTCVAFERQWL